MNKYLRYTLIFATSLMALYKSVLAADGSSVIFEEIPPNTLTIEHRFKGTIEIENVISPSNSSHDDNKKYQDHKKLLDKSTDLQHIDPDDYPVRSRRLKECGVVEFSIDVSPNGSVRAVNIINSPYPTLASAIEALAKSWSFLPYSSMDGVNSITEYFKANFRLFNDDGAELECKP